MSILKNGLNVDRYVVEVLTKTHRGKYKQPQRHFLCNFNLLKNVSNSLYWHHIITCSKCLRISFATQISTLFGDFKIQLFSSEFVYVGRIMRKQNDDSVQRLG